MPDQHYADDLERWIRMQRPQTLLIISSDDDPLRERLSASVTAQVTCIRPDDYRTLGAQVFDVAVVLCALETLDRARASALLARLRDLAARRTMALVRMGEYWPGTESCWQRNDLLGYGFQLFARYAQDERPIHLYRFDLYDYKPVPEWLNARHWAHPELWGKYRW